MLAYVAASWSRCAHLEYKNLALLLNLSHLQIPLATLTAAPLFYIYLRLFWRAEIEPYEPGNKSSWSLIWP